MPVGIRSHRQRDHDGQARESVREMKQEPQRRLVGPLGVVDGEQQRSAFGEVDHQPIQPVQGGERHITGLLGRSDVGEDRFGQPRRARQQPIAFGAVSTGHRAFEQLANDPEAESALQLSAARGQYGHFCRGCASTQRLQQHRFPDACRTLDQQHPAGACDGFGQRSVERAEVVHTIEQRSLFA